MPGLRVGTSAEFEARCSPWSWAGCASQSACCLYQRADNFASHMHEASGSLYLCVSWSCSPTRGTLHPSYACGSTCTKQVPQKWTLEAAQSWEADLVHKGRSTLRSRCSQAPAQWTCEAASLQHPHQRLQEQQEPHRRLSRETPVCVCLGRQDAARVCRGEDQPAAEGELLLAPVCLVSALSFDIPPRVQHCRLPLGTKGQSEQMCLGAWGRWGCEVGRGGVGRGTKGPGVRGTESPCLAALRPASPGA